MWNPTFSCVPTWRIENFIASRSLNPQAARKGQTQE